MVFTTRLRASVSSAGLSIKASREHRTDQNISSQIRQKIQPRRHVARVIYSSAQPLLAGFVSHVLRISKITSSYLHAALPVNGCYH